MKFFDAFMKSVNFDSPYLSWMAHPAAQAIFILVIGWMIARIARRLIRKANIPGATDATTLTVRPVIAKVTFYLILLSALYAALTKLGVPTGSLLAVFGGAALAIGLALQGTLSNIAAGIMLLILHPIRVGEYIETPSVNGTILQIGLFSTTVKNVEGLTVFVPNSEIWKNRIQNYARHDVRKLLVDIGVSYDADLNETKRVLLRVMENDERVLSEPTPPECHVMSFGDSSVNLSCRCWMAGDGWLPKASDIRIALKTALDEAGIEIPFPQRVVKVLKD
ncbi:MAG: mechanosensitive ion channel family protein [Hellea sp.]|nr:mechanosensitive ion channel family protein [Hellea sp.]